MRYAFLHRVWVLLVLVLLAMSISTPLFAQASPEGRISGIVRDPSGAVVPDATITVTSESTGGKYMAKGSSEGNFMVPSIPAGSYTVQIEAKGFKPSVYTQVVVQATREYSLNATLQVGSATQVVEVTAGQELVNTTSTEVSKTVTSTQVQNLPLLGRDIITLLSTQPGAGSSGRTYTVINGGRPSWSQVTLDGINIQDPFIRVNALDYIPNRPTTDMVQEFTVTSSTQGVDTSLGSSGVRMVTSSGTNKFHGGVWEFNRNNAFAANSWFRNNTVPITPRPFRNRNEFGAKFGGPVLRNKLFFYATYVGIIDKQRAALNQVIPTHDDYLQGVFRYVDTKTSAIQSVNVISVLPGVALDSKIASMLSTVPKAASVNNYSVGNSTASRILNTAGFMQNQSSNYDRKNLLLKFDYELSAKHHFDTTYSQMHEVTQRPGYDPINLDPMYYNDSHPKLTTGAWRWTIADNLINNVRVGVNLVDAPFLSKVTTPPSFLLAEGSTESSSATFSGIGVQSQQLSFQPQGRQANQYQLLDDATWIKGRHSIKFGMSYALIRLFTWNYRATMPTVTTGFSINAPKSIQLTAANFPGSISSTDLTAANNLRAFLGGLISSESQTFQVASTTSGYVMGAPNIRRLPMSDLMFYGQDQFRLRPNFTVNLGLKWEYLTPYKEANGIAMGPVYANSNTPLTTLMDANTQIGLLKRGWNPDLNNFAPSVGFAWDPKSDGKTSIRFGYSLNYINDEQFRFAGNAAEGNAGLTSGVTVTGLYQTLAGGVPAVPVPAFKVPRTLADQIAISPGGAIWALNPNVQMPKVHEISAGIQRELPGQFSMEVRYVGTLGRELLRGIDLNQQKSGDNQAYIDDFNRARNNGYLSAAAGKGWNPTYNSAVPGSQQLTFIPNIVNAMNYLTSSTIVGYLQQNQAAALADYFTYYRGTFTNGPQTFLPNPAIYAVDYGYNGGFSSYHALQVEVNRRYRNGLQFQSNYTWGKVLTDAPFTDGNQTRFDPLLDNNRPWLAKARADFDLKQAFKANASYDLPIGKGKMLLSGVPAVVDHIIGGWSVSAIYTLQSGNPFTIYSTRQTFNRRTGNQTAVSTLTQKQIQKYLGVYRGPDGTMYFIDPRLTDPNTGRAVGPDTQTQAASSNFNQVFFNPVAGGIGNLGNLAFDGPAYTDLDLGIKKAFKIREGMNLAFRADMFNAPNHPTFYFGDREVNSTGFAKITSTNTAARTVQFSLRFDF